MLIKNDNRSFLFIQALELPTCIIRSQFYLLTHHLKEYGMTPPDFVLKKKKKKKKIASIL